MRTFFRLVAIAVLATPVVTGCGDDSGTADDAGGDSSQDGDASEDGGDARDGEPDEDGTGADADAGDGDGATPDSWDRIAGPGVCGARDVRRPIPSSWTVPAREGRILVP